MHFQIWQHNSNQSETMEGRKPNPPEKRKQDQEKSKKQFEQQQESYACSETTTNKT